MLGIGVVPLFCRENKCIVPKGNADLLKSRFSKSFENIIDLSMTILIYFQYKGPVINFRKLLLLKRKRQHQQEEAGVEVGKLQAIQEVVDLKEKRKQPKKRTNRERIASWMHSMQQTKLQRTIKCKIGKIPILWHFENKKEKH